MFRPRLSSINLEIKDMGMLGGADLEFQPCVVSKGFELTPIECPIYTLHGANNVCKGVLY